MEKRKRIIKKILSVGIIFSAVFIGSFTISNAVESEEVQLKSILNTYGVDNVNIEDGEILRIGEVMKLPRGSEWNLSTEGVISIKNGQIEAIGTGTVFLSFKNNNKLHVIEIYVPESQERITRYYSPIDENRDYYKVIVDAGHGGYDSGATGFGRRESIISLEIAKKVEQKLKQKNIQVKMIRDGDYFVPLKDRPRIANEYRPDAFISIHLNSASSGASGIETHCQKGKQMYSPLSKEIQNHVIARTGAKNRGIKYSDLCVLRESNMPSALLETGFITNRDECNRLIEPSYQERLAIGVADGIEEYLKNTVLLQNLPVINTGVVINTDQLNVRSGYGTNYSIIGHLKGNERVEIVEKGNNGWYKIKYNGSYGYVSGRYIRVGQVGLYDINGHWAKDLILDFVVKGYVNGYEDNTFKPENSITRAEFIKIVNREFNFNDTANMNFIDVRPDSWYYNEVCKAIRAGYINGYEDNTFRPEKPITREEACVIVSRIKNLRGDGKLWFKDNNQISDWAKNAVDILSDNGIIKGKPGNVFKPLENITRAESVTVLSRAENK